MPDQIKPASHAWRPFPRLSVRGLDRAEESDGAAHTCQMPARQRYRANCIVPGSASTIVAEGPGNPNRGPAV